MKIELTIKTDYLPKWGVYEGIRELVQNGRDSELDGAPLTVRRRGDILVIENEGAVLPHEALLLGHTTKAGRADQAGKWGEGLKLGVLALVRAGVAVRIRSGSEVWVPSIARSEKFNADVLVFEILGGRKDEARVSVEVKGVGDESWANLKRAFRFLHGAEKSLSAVKTSRGTLLLDSEEKGRVYVKGILVQTDSRLALGYDLSDAELDRDRKMIDGWDLNYRVGQIWQEALATRPDLVDQYAQLLQEDTRDVDDAQHRAANLPEAARAAVAAQFTAQHGSSALPVANLAESADVAHYGRKGIIVPKALGAVLAEKFGSREKLQAELQNEAYKLYAWHELLGTEQQNLTEALVLVTAAGEPVTLESVTVADFRSPHLRGTFQAGTITLAKRILADRDETLATLVHEAAHRGGGDGEKGHVERLESLWSGIVKNLR